MQDTERLVKNYEKLLAKVKDLEEAKRTLEERLATSQNQQQELQEKLATSQTQQQQLQQEKQILEEKLATSQKQQQEIQQKLASLEKQSEIDAKGVSTIKELRSNVTRLLKDSETMKIG
jgi:chromosome segregation ATPase